MGRKYHKRAGLRSSPVTPGEIRITRYVAGEPLPVLVRPPLRPDETMKFWGRMR